MSIRFRNLCSIIAVILVLTQFVSCQAKPNAVLHSPEQNGYIPVLSQTVEAHISSPQAFIYDVENEGA